MKKMRMLSMVLALLLTASLSLAVFAAGPAKITVEKQTEAVNAGNEVTLAVTISDNPGFMSGSWNIKYDSSKLELKSINTKLDGGLCMDGACTPNVAQNTITYANAKAVEGDGTLFTLTFLVKENAASGETVVTVSTKELFTKGLSGKVSIDNVPVAGGVTVAGSTTGGSTTGGSTTGGSTTGGSTTGGSTTGGSTTGGSTTGGSTTGGSTTGGSTTGGSTTGGSTTGGSTTGGSTTGGSTTGGSTTGGSTTGGSTTGGSTTGGSTTGGSTTGGSTTGGNTTGGTGSERNIELVGTSNVAKYEVTGNTLNVQNDAACVVLYTIDNGETYTKLAATANEAGGYDFDLTNVPTNAVIKIAIKGDFNMDGSVDALDAVMVNRAAARLLPHNELQSQIGHVGESDTLDGLDALLINRSAAGKYTIAW